MKPTFRPYQSEEDYWRMREFLRRVFGANSRLERSWHVARLDYARWHLCLNCDKVRLEDIVFLWETDCAHSREQEMVAIVMPEGGPGEAHLMIHPDYHTAELEEEMLSIAEERLASTGPDGLRKLCVWSPEQNSLRQSILGKRGYEKRNAAECQWRRDLDLVAIAPDGAVAAFCTIWFDDVTRSAYVEPLATVPAHRRLGLGRALLTEGLRRLQRMGAMRAFVGGFSPAANALYASVMGPEHELYEPWVKKW